MCKFMLMASLMLMTACGKAVDHQEVFEFPIGYEYERHDVNGDGVLDYVVNSGIIVRVEFIKGVYVQSDGDASWKRDGSLVRETGNTANHSPYWGQYYVGTYLGRRFPTIVFDGNNYPYDVRVDQLHIVLVQ